MPPREWRVRIEDIRGAVSRCLGIIGEAAARIRAESVAAHPEIPWAELRGMRNIVVHEYFGVTDLGRGDSG